MNNILSTEHCMKSTFTIQPFPNTPMINSIVYHV